MPIVALNKPYPPTRRPLIARCMEVVRLFGPFGFIAFGGTAANIVMLRKIFVDGEKWVDDKTFIDLFALGSALPGPSFSQLGFAIALLRGGYIPALLSFVLLTAPGAFAMLGFGFGVRHIPNALPDVVYALFSGVNAAAVGLIALAAYDLATKVITDPFTRIVVVFSGSFGICLDSQWLTPIIMVVGGSSSLLWDSVTRWHQERLKSKLRNDAETAIGDEHIAPQVATSHDRIERREQPGSYGTITPALLAATPSADPTHSNGSRSSEVLVSEHAQQEDEPEIESPYFTLSIQRGVVITVLFTVFFITLIVLRATVVHQKSFQFFVNLLIAGTIIFGGGPVVIPLLRTYTVDPGWVNPRDFLLGFAVIQALPGPLFNFAVYLGVLTLPDQPFVGAILGLVAIFLPGLVLKVGLLPLYTKLRSSQAMQSVLRGLNAAAVGLIFAAIYHLFRIGFVSAGSDPNSPAVYASLDQDGWWVVTTAISFVVCKWFNVLPPIAIAGGAIGGIGWWGVHK